MQEFQGLTAEMYRAIVAIIDDRLGENRLIRDGFGRLEDALTQLAEAQSRTGVQIEQLGRRLEGVEASQARTEAQVGQFENRMDRVEAALERLAEAQARTEARVGQLENRMDRVEAALERLAEAQARTEARVGQLENRMDRVEAALERLAEAQARTEARVGQLENRMDRVEAALERLAEAQARTEARIDQLAEAQARTEARIDQLAEAQARTEARIDQLAEAQARTEARIDQLAEAQARTESALQQLARQVGGLSETVGGDIEDIAYIVLYDVLKREFGWEVGELERTWQQWNGTQEEVNIFGQAIDPAQPERTIWIVGEAKHNLTLREVERFAPQVERARQYLGGEVYAVCFAYRARPEVRTRLRELGIPLLFSYGRFA